MKYLCSYVLALANIFIRTEARLLADYKPALRVNDKLQFIEHVSFHSYIFLHEYLPQSYIFLHEVLSLRYIFSHE